MRRLAVGAGVALSMLVSTGCTDLNVWGAQQIGAPIVDYGEQGAPTWYTGHATKSRAACELAVYYDSRIEDWKAPFLCAAFRVWRDGDMGYRP